MKTVTKTGLILILFLAFTITLSAQEIFDAVRNGDLSKVKELVEKDPQLVKARNYSSSTVLHAAAAVDNDLIAKYLIEMGADIAAINGESDTPVMMAGIKVAKILIGKGAIIDFRNLKYETPCFLRLQKAIRN